MGYCILTEHTEMQREREVETLLLILLIQISVPADNIADRHVPG